MIRITVELIPKGCEARARTLGVMEIANDKTGTPDVGNYTGTLHAEYTSPSGRTGRITRFSRKRQSVWSLVGAFLKLFGHTKHSPSLMTTNIARDLQQPHDGLPGVTHAGAHERNLL